MTKSPEYEDEDISKVLKRKSNFEKQQQIDKEHADDIKKRIEALYDAAGKILDISPVMPADASQFEVPHPHRISPAVNFTNQDEIVALRLCELVSSRNRPNERYGVRIELADDSLSFQKRLLFSIYPHMVVDLKDKQLHYENAHHSQLNIEEPEKIIQVFGNALGY
jgi:hypothetical protein